MTMIRILFSRQKKCVPLSKDFDLVCLKSEYIKYFLPAFSIYVKGLSSDIILQL